jgi:predicted homoserine dehydrogenase-like protein
MWRPFHLIGLETSVSVLNAVLRGEATGSSTLYRADAVATAKGDFKAGDYLDGEGGFKVWAKAIPATRAAKVNALPIGLAHHIKLKRDIARDQIVTLDDVEIKDDLDIFEMRRALREMANG